MFWINTKEIEYLKKHRIAYKGVERRVMGKNTLRGRLHDIDKFILLFFFPVDIVEKIHLKLSRHHFNSVKNKKDYFYMILNWESNLLVSKTGEMINAYDRMNEKYPCMKDKILPILKELNLDLDTKNYNKKYIF